MSNLILLLKHGGFFRDTNGLNNLQTFKRFAQILNKPDGFSVDFVAKPISAIINGLSQSKLNLDKSLKIAFLDDQPFPIIYLLGIEHPDQCMHAVVLKGWRKVGSKIMLKVRNSLKGQIIFGQTQPGEHEIEYKVTQNNNAWNLFADMCVHLKIN